MVYVNKPRNIRDLMEEIRLVVGDSKFHGQSSCMPALQRWSYVWHHFPYFKSEGELNMFMFFFNLFWKNKVHNLTYQNWHAFWRTCYKCWGDRTSTYRGQQMNAAAKYSNEMREIELSVSFSSLLPFIVLLFIMRKSNKIF